MWTSLLVTSLPRSNPAEDQVSSPAVQRPFELEDFSGGFRPSHPHHHRPMFLGY
ncbi:uncharacterized protein BDV14DRAFT_164514 [Aspergillus stella-maris]|uniref:uncharacterized protein n=1 Tax=Aspergillus stella-maris TaxID=1810926 RepID=UPI003CCD3528